MIFRTRDGFRSAGHSGRVNKAFHQPQQLQNIRLFFGKTGNQFDQFLMVTSDRENKKDLLMKSSLFIPLSVDDIVSSFWKKYLEIRFGAKPPGGNG